MAFPLEVTSSVALNNGSFGKTLFLNKGLTVLLGPNGSGKTQVLRGLKVGLEDHANGKKIRFLSAGRMGMLEQYRSDYDGHRRIPRYDAATYGGKGDAERRHQIETINGDFHTLAARMDIFIKIQERLRKLFKRDLLIQWDAGNLKILFSHLDPGSLPYSSGREASGLMHLVGILSALYDDEVGALLLDEPEVSLHPQLQSFLLKEILNVAGHPSDGENKKLVVIATHSTEMVQISRPDDLLSLVFCYDLNSDLVQIPKDAGVLNNKKIQRLISRLGQEHKLALFSKRPLLVEGPSDVMICSALSSKADMHLEAAGSQLLPVIGKGQMPVVAKLLRLLGKEPVALADADGIADGLELVNQFLADCPAADKDAADLGFESSTAMANNIYRDFCKLVQDRWDELAKNAEVHPYWVNKTEENDTLAKRRAAFCTLFTITDDELSELATDDAWVTIKHRLSALLGVLEKSGLFVLRKGSIESYYQKSDCFTSIGKPSAAADELEYIHELGNTEIQGLYEDILRCIKFASDAEPICEADALKDLLIAVAAPAHAKLKEDSPVEDYNFLAKSILGDRANIFDLAVKGDSLVISIKSNILRVSGFPIIINKRADAVNVISSVLGNKALQAS